MDHDSTLGATLDKAIDVKVGSKDQAPFVVVTVLDPLGPTHVVSESECSYVSYFQNAGNELCEQLKTK